MANPCFSGGSQEEHRINSTRDLSTALLAQGFSSSSEEKPLQFVGTFFVFTFGCGSLKRAAERGSGGPDPLMLGGPSYRK